MGYGEFMGNGSVHWRVLHEEYEDVTGTPASTARKREIKTARARMRTADVAPTVPAVHIDNLDVLDFEARGKDTVTLDQIGRCCGTKDHEGRFRVELRFRTRREAKAALAKAALHIRLDQKMYVVTLDVPVINRTEAQVGPPADPPAEVKVDW